MAGRYSLRPEVTSIDVLVSILARLNGRALPEANPARPAEQVKFQSSPGLMAGRYPELVSWYSAGDVSILARLNGRALPGHQRGQRQGGHSFNPRPA